METYSLLREIADSWMLLAMFIFFVGVAIWAFLPSQRAAREDARLIPFRDETDAKTRAGAERKSAGQTDAKKLEGQVNV
tara:strand:- start:4236 stop:4472 length:237 start_codon:yes stop_codon:yes gene_type:complete